MNELMHYASHPVPLLREWPYDQNEPRCFGKPVGFWVSVSGEQDWPAWCRDEEFDLRSLEYAHRVTLSDTAKILRIETPEGIDTFHSTYAVEGKFERQYATEHFRWPIDWQRVTNDCDGIIIAPYQCSRRFKPDWYYGWDCASGCIWNLDAIASVDLIDSEVSA